MKLYYMFPNGLNVYEIQFLLHDSLRKIVILGEQNMAAKLKSGASIEQVWKLNEVLLVYKFK